MPQNEDRQKILMDWCKKSFRKPTDAVVWVSAYDLVKGFKNSEGGFFVANEAIVEAMCAAGYEIRVLYSEFAVDPESAAETLRWAI